VISRETSAVHESGHAVAAQLMAVGVRRIALLDSGGGVCELDGLPADGREVRRACFVLLMGEAACKHVHLPDIAPAWRL
jgi:hypothetical protein